MFDKLKRFKMKLAWRKHFCPSCSTFYGSGRGCYGCEFDGKAPTYYDRMNAESESIIQEAFGWKR